MTEDQEFWEGELAYYQRKIDGCERCDSTGWIESKGPFPDGSYTTARPCINRCDEYITEAAEIRAYLNRKYPKEPS